MFLEELEAERVRLQELSQKALAEQSSTIGGSLRITHSNNKPHYYHRKSPSDKNGEYISIENKKLIHELAQKQYSEAFLSCVNTRITHLDILISDYRKVDLAHITDSYNDTRRNLITPYVLSDKAFARQWLNTPFEPDSSHPEKLIFETAQGLKVRSKSEQIIAENLTYMGIPFKYESPICTKKGQIIHPDFTMLNAHRRSIIYYEHFGKMNDAEYIDYFFFKVKTYNQLGMVLGKNLLFTFEDREHPFDFSSHRHIFEDLLLK